MNATHAGRWQFSVRSMLLTLACCSLVFAVMPVLGVVGGSTALMMIIVYLAIRRLPVSWQIRSAICFCLFAVPPHFGVPGYYFGPNVGEWEPPQFEYIGNLETLLPIAWTFDVLYLIGEFPLQLLSLSNSWSDYLGFHGDVFRVRPFAVWTFWLQMTAAALLAVVASQIERRRSRSRNPIGLAVQANALPGEQGSLNQVESQAAAEPTCMAAR